MIQPSLSSSFDSYDGPPLSGLRTRDDGLAMAPSSNTLVLVVDDVEDTRTLWTETLTDAGYEVVEATDGAAAVEIALRRRPRVILMDMSMPGMDGWEATQRIRAGLDDAKEIAIIAVSAMAGVDGRAEAFRSGCDGFVAKPTTPNVVVDVVNAFVDVDDDD